MRSRYWTRTLLRARYSLIFFFPTLSLGACLGLFSCTKYTGDRIRYIHDNELHGMVWFGGWWLVETYMIFGMKESSYAIWDQCARDASCSKQHLNHIDITSNPYFRKDYTFMHPMTSLIINLNNILLRKHLLQSLQQHIRMMSLENQHRPQPHRHLARPSNVDSMCFSLFQHLVAPMIVECNERALPFSA
jgi:hypothetical protein